MTDFDSSARDELVAAYLDGDASEDERAQVEADEELLARVEVHREIAAMVAEPVVPPDTAVRNSHIAAALQASATAPNVTSLTPRKRRWTPQYTRALGAAAAVAVVLFAGTLLVLTNDKDGDDTATSVSASGTADGSSELADTGDGAQASEAEAAPAPADEPAPAPAPEPAAEEAPQAADDPGQAADDGGGDASTAADEDELSLAGQLAEATLRYQLVDLPTIDALAAAVTNDVDEFRRGESDGTTDLVRSPTCVLEIEALAQAQSPAATLVFVAGGSVAGTPIEYVVFEEFADTTMVVFEASTCSILDTVALA